MSSKDKTKNDDAWEKLFDKYHILQQIDTEGKFQISADAIKEFREPRLMTKFDHSINLPSIFADNHLAILPITRGDYIIGRFDVYHDFEDDCADIAKAHIPDYIQSLNIDNITSETVALNAAVASGIIADFLEEDGDKLVATVSGRMGSGSFSFKIDDHGTKNSEYQIHVDKSQIEIDAAYEGAKSLSIFEAKRDLSKDFLVRQLYYPFRVWKDRMGSKPVRPVFLIYSNGIYRIMEYSFENFESYNSLRLVKQKRYSIEDTTITIDDILDVLNNVIPCDEPENIPFPQADSFARVINICELIQLSNDDLTRDKVTEKYEFDERQTNYYTDAARYLGLVSRGYKKDNGKRVPIYTLTAKGIKILSKNYKQRQLCFCRCILEHKVFADALKEFLKTGKPPTKSEIVKIMYANHIERINDKTKHRRSSSVIGWINWIVGLNNET
jgi:hypothetical protein